MVTIGLDKLYYAKITEDTSGNETYEDPLPFDNQQQETTQKETTSVAQSSSETTKSEETTTAQETTKSNEITTA